LVTLTQAENLHEEVDGLLAIQAHHGLLQDVHHLVDHDLHDSEEAVEDHDSGVEDEADLEEADESLPARISISQNSLTEQPQP
jgi:hypothetical protein